MGLSIGGAPAHGRVMPGISVQNLTNDADVIVIGEVVDVHIIAPAKIGIANGETLPAELTSATVRVDQVLKGGDVGPSIEIEYLHNPNWEQGPITGGLSPKTYQMVFLKRSSGKYAFADLAYPSLPLPRERVSGMPLPPTGDAYSAVLLLLAGTLFAPNVPGQERISALFNLTISDDHTPYLTEIVRTALNSSAASADPDFRDALVAALVRRKDATVLPELQIELLTPGPGERLNSRGNLIFALQAIDGKISVPILARALTLPDGELRQDAARALQNVGSGAPQEAVDALLSALDDPDRDVQFYVMQSLGYLNQELYWRPHTTDPKEDFGNPSWSECVDHWRQFATSRSSSSPRPKLGSVLLADPI